MSEFLTNCGLGFEMMRYVQIVARELHEQEAVVRSSSSLKACEDTEQPATEAIADILHVCALRGLEPDRILEEAFEAYREETMIGAELAMGRYPN